MTDETNKSLFRLEIADDPCLDDDSWYLKSNEDIHIQVSQMDGTFRVHRWSESEYPGWRGTMEVTVAKTLTEAMALAIEENTRN